MADICDDVFVNPVAEEEDKTTKDVHGLVSTHLDPLVKQIIIW